MASRDDFAHNRLQQEDNDDVDKGMSSDDRSSNPSSTNCADIKDQFSTPQLQHKSDQLIMWAAISFVFSWFCSTVGLLMIPKSLFTVDASVSLVLGIGLLLTSFSLIFVAKLLYYRFFKQLQIQVTASCKKSFESVTNPSSDTEESDETIVPAAALLNGTAKRRNNIKTNNAQMKLQTINASSSSRSSEDSSQPASFETSSQTSTCDDFQQPTPCDDISKPHAAHVSPSAAENDSAHVATVTADGSSQTIARSSQTDAGFVQTADGFSQTVECSSLIANSSLQKAESLSQSAEGLHPVDKSFQPKHDTT